KFVQRGVQFDAPQLDEGNFEELTISRMLEVTERAIRHEPVVLMGSSLGGFVAGLFSARKAVLVERMILLAPALQFAARWKLRFSAEEMTAWKDRGWAPFYHYAHKRDERLGYSFVADAANYDYEPDFPQPALLLHGTEDAVVSVE